MKTTRNKSHRESTYLASARQDEALRSSHEYFMALMENSADAVIVINEDGTVPYESLSYQRLLGFKPEDRFGNNLFERVHPDDIERVAELFAELLQNRGGTLRAEVRAKHNDGSWRFIDAIGSNLLDNPVVKGIIVNYRDITERKKAEEALRESEEKYRLHFENVSDVIFSYDRELRILSVSPSVKQMLGYSPEELIGKRFTDLNILAPECLELALSNALRTLEGQRVGVSEYIFIAKDGSRKYGELSEASPLFADGKVVAVLSVGRDITERKRIEEELRLLSDAVRMSKDGIAITDLEGKYLEANDATLKMHGVENRADFIGKRATEFIAPEELEMLTDRMAKALASGYVPHIEYHCLKNDGSKFPVESSISVIKNRSGEPTGYVAVARDITERKNMEEALQTSDRLYRLLAENVRDVIWIVDMNLRLTYTSPSITQLTGYRLEEYITKTLEEILTPASVEFVTNLFAEELTLDESGHRDLFRTRTFEAELICKDGSNVPVEMKATAIRDADGRPIGVLGVSRDISDRKLAEEALRQREKDYSLLLESTHEGIVVFDAGTLKIVFGNRRAVLMFGFDPILRDAIGVDILDLVHPEDREVVLKGLAEDLNTSERRKRYEVRAKAKDGREIWVSALATRIEFQGRLAVLLSLKDITDQKRAEEAIKAYREDYATLVENLSDAVFKFKDGIVVWCNDKVKEIYGYSRDELIGKDASFFIPADREPLEFIRSVYAVIKKDGCYRGSARAKTKGGGTIDIEYSISQIPNKHHIELVTVARDVTERRNLEEQIQLAGRLAAVGELAAGVAHELNNPLAAIQGFAQLLTKSNDLNEDAKKGIDTIYREAQRSAKITQNLLSFARKHKPERQLISINEALEKTLELRAHQMKVNNIELSVQLQPDLPMTVADFYQMQQLFMNIIINAEQAMLEAHGRGRLSIQTRKVDKVIQMTFTDDGPGILEENLDRIFDPFFTTKEPGKGTGLGLSICYGIVKAHAGQISVRSKPVKGATFVVEIPIVTQDGPIAESR